MCVCSASRREKYSCFSDAVQAGTSGPLSQFSQCENANISICTSTETLPFIVTAYNSLPRSNNELIRIPVSVAVGDIQVQDSKGNIVPYDVFANPSYDISK